MRGLKGFLGWPQEVSFPLQLEHWWEIQAIPEFPDLL